MTTKERPILFNGTMVRAILAGQKTVTRRVCVEMPSAPGLHALVGGYGWNGNVESPALVKYDEVGVSVWPFRASRCGGVGDRLWVRESFAVARDVCDSEGTVDDVLLWKGPMPKESPIGRRVFDDWRVGYMADSTDDEKGWRPSIHMPRWASRLSLDVVSVGVERVQAITDEDARREGIEPVNGGWGLDGESWSCGSARGAFQTLWDIVCAEGASWRANPWVWRVEFARAVSR